ncbi:MAG: metal ABC transporter substrate-binding protein [Angustibacter sp.]
MKKPLSFAAPIALAMLGLTACGSTDESASSGQQAGADTGRLQVVTSFYPLQYLAERIGGDQVEVTSLTKPGAEPHDLELTPQDVAGLQEADLVVYLKGFQPSVDEAVSTTAPKATFDAAGSARLTLTYTPIEEGKEETEEAGSTDPHFWLDPTRMSEVAAALQATMAKAAPQSASQFESALASLRTELTALDTEYREGLRSCTSRDLVTSHNAFGYLAERYDLTQEGITGLSPEAEPSPRQLASVADFVKKNDVRTIYSETLVSPAIAETVAKETSARTAVLDPIEGLTDDSAGEGYREVMRANLESLRKGQSCS